MRYLFDDANEKVGDVQKAIKSFMQGAQLGTANCMRQLDSWTDSAGRRSRIRSKARKWRAKELGII